MKKIIAGVLVVLSGVVIGYYLKHPIILFSENVEPAAQGPRAESPLIAVSIDNDPAARPQAGLQEADTVMETLVEGGVTRFLAFYSAQGGQAAQRIGPVRSARPYFVDWALGEGAVLAHSGGSKEALERIAESEGLLDANEFYNEKYYWRDGKKPAPHNLFTSAKLLGELAERKNWGSAPTNTAPTNGQATGSAVTQINISFSYPLYAVSFIYDPATQTYERKQTGSPKVTPANIIILYTDSTVIDKNLLTIDLRTTGSGKAAVFTGGGVRQARWKKESAQSPLRILDADDTAVTLSAGQTWIAVLDQRGSASWK